MSETEEIAKAVQSVANFGEQSIEASQKLGGFFARVFKAPLEEVSGMITDKLRFIRWQKLAQICDGVNKVLEAKGVKKTKAVPPKLALPIFEEGSLEEDSSLQSLWINLLANAMNPDFKDEIRRGFIDIIKNITSKEALIIKYFYEYLESLDVLQNIGEVTNYVLEKEKIKQHVKIDEEQYQVCIHNLMRMQCVVPAFLEPIKTIHWDTDPTMNYQGTRVVTLTPLGVKFVEACIK